MASLRDFYEVNQELARPSAPLSFYEVDKAIVSKGEVLPPSIIHKCQLVDTLVGEGVCAARCAISTSLALIL